MVASGNGLVPSGAIGDDSRHPALVRLERRDTPRTRDTPGLAQRDHLLRGRDRGLADPEEPGAHANEPTAVSSASVVAPY